MSLKNITQSLQLDYQELFDRLPLMLFATTTKWKIIYRNEQLVRYIGASELNRSDFEWIQTIHSADQKLLIKKWTASAKKLAPFEIDARLRRHDGRYRWHMIHVMPLQNKRGNLYGWFGYCTDVDELRRASTREHQLEIITRALRDQRSELVALNRSKDEFISLASHQLRTPATGVKQYLGLMLEGYSGKLTKPQRQMLETAYESNERQINTVNYLLRVAQADAGKIRLEREKVELVALIEDIIREQQPKFDEKRLEIIFEHSQKRLYATIDKSRMRMVIENLVDNAYKYTPPNKQVVVRAEKGKNTVHITVQDKGVGIKKADLQRLFQKFSRIENQLSAQAGGTGLGLYWAQKIVNLHEGNIIVKSTPGKGSAFTISFPKR